MNLVTRMLVETRKGESLVHDMTGHWCAHSTPHRARLRTTSGHFSFASSVHFQRFDSLFVGISVFLCRARPRKLRPETICYSYATGPCQKAAKTPFPVLEINDTTKTRQKLVTARPARACPDRHTRRFVPLLQIPCRRRFDLRVANMSHVQVCNSLFLVRVPFVELSRWVCST